MMSGTCNQMHRSGRSATLDFQSYQSVFSADYWVEIIIGLELEIKSVIIGMENLHWVGINFKPINNYPRPNGAPPKADACVSDHFIS